MKSSILYQGAAILGLALATTQAHAVPESKIDEIVVTATRTETPIEQIGSTVYVVTAKEIEKKQWQTVAEALQSVPGVTVNNGSGGVFGQAINVYLRGSESRHVLVLMNGIPVNDPSQPTDTFDFSRLNTDGIERIEVLQGAQSTLYGSKAAAGVINIITRKSTKDEVSFKVEAGSFSTFKESTTLSGGNRYAQFLIDFSQLNSKGIDITNNGENDGYRQASLTSTVSLTPDATTEIDFLGKYQRSTAEYDFGLDPLSKAFESTGSLKISKSLFDNQWKQYVSISQNRITREYPSSVYEGQTNKYDWQHTIKIVENHTVVGGVEKVVEEATSRKIDTHSLYLNDQFSIGRDLHINIGGRLDDHEQFGTKSTYRFAGAYELKNLRSRLKASIGKGFKAPSLDQMYNSHDYRGDGGSQYYASPFLKPERSTTWDVGFETELPIAKTKISSTWFRSDYSDLIQHNRSTYYYENIAKAHMYGIESNLTFKPTDSTDIRLNHTFTMTDNGAGKELAQRPRNKSMLSASYLFSAKSTISMDINWYGPKYNDSYSTSRSGSYYLANIASAYMINKSVQIYGRVDNLFNRDYVVYTGYNTPGIAGYAGVKVSF